MRLGVVYNFKRVVVIAEKCVLTLLDGNIPLIWFRFEVVDKNAFIGYHNKHVFEDSHFANFEVALEIIDIALVEKV